MAGQNTAAPSLPCTHDQQCNFDSAHQEAGSQVTEVSCRQVLETAGSDLWKRGDRGGGGDWAHLSELLKAV